MVFVSHNVTRSDGVFVIGLSETGDGVAWPNLFIRSAHRSCRLIQGFGLWQGRLRLGDHWAAWHGEVGDGELHRHFAAQAILSECPIRVFDVHGHNVEACCVLIDPLTHHKVQSGGEALLGYVEPGKHLSCL